MSVGFDSGWVRPAAVAGLFYDDDPEVLRAQVEGFVASAPPWPDATPPKAVIAPHAGLRYSGPTAGVAYRAVADRRGSVTRVVLLGPAHRVAVPGIGVSTARAWATPLGEVPLDQKTARSLLAHPAVIPADEAHAPEHSLEVHLPFLITVLGSFTLLPLIVGNAEPDQVADVLDLVWGGDETLVVASSDLSHFHDDATARARDRRTAAAVVAGDVSSIGPRDACGAGPVRGLLVECARKGLEVRLLDLSTSHDTIGSADRVVGYGSFAVSSA